MFSEHTLYLLKCAGWHEDYVCDTQSEEKLYETAGCPLPPVVLDFMRRFGDLHIRNPSAIPPNPQEFDFDVLGEVDPEHYDYLISHLCSELDYLCEVIGIEISPMYAIGTFQHNAYLLMTVEGKVYMHHDDLWYVGESGEDAIEALCTGRDLPFIPVPPEEA